MEIFKDLTEEEFINEFNIFVDVLPNSNLYIPGYFNELFNLELFKQDFFDLLKFANSQENCKTICFNKVDYIERTEDNKLFVNIEKLKLELDNLFQDFILEDNSENLELKDNVESPDDKMEKFKNCTISKLLNHNTSYTSFKIFTNKINKKKYTINSIIIYQLNNNIQITKFHELCHALQNNFNIEEYRNLSGILNTKYSLEKLSPEEKELPENIQIKIKNDKLLFLNNFKMETQADLFADMVILLRILKDKTKDYFIETKDKILFKRSKYYINSIENYYFDFPILYNETIYMELNPEKYLKKFMLDNGKINFQELYDYTREKVLEKTQIYEKFFLENENIDLNLYLKYLNKYNRPEDIEIQYKLSSDLYLDYDFMSYYNYNVSKNFNDNLNFINVDKFICLYEFSIKKEKKLEKIEDFLKNYQTKLTDENYNRIKDCCDRMLDKCKDLIK